MRYLLYVVVLLLLVTCCVKKQNNTGNSAVPSGKPDPAKSILVIDVRTPEEYSAEHIGGAINIPVNVIEKEIENHTRDKSQKILLYCRTGNRSGQALEILKSLGYVNVENIGGYEEAQKRLK
jgi:phage shock protein E